MIAEAFPSEWLQQQEQIQKLMQRIPGAQLQVPPQQETRSVEISQSEVDALRARISSCWAPPPGIDVNSKVYVVLHVLFKADGSMLQAPVLVESSASPLAPALAESAKRALQLCQPFTMLKPEHYDQWKDIELKFDPHELLISDDGEHQQGDRNRHDMRNGN